MIYQFIPIGDYCHGLVNGFIFLFFGAIFILTFLIITIRDIIKHFKKKQKFDFIPLFLALLLGVSCHIIMGMENKKFWTKKILFGNIEMDGTPRSGTLKLYKNGSFGATHHYVDFSCTFQGYYEIKKDTLYLNRKDLGQLTEGLFTTTYSIDRKNNILEPTIKNFNVIKIVKILE